MESDLREHLTKGGTIVKMVPSFYSVNRGLVMRIERRTYITIPPLKAAVYVLLLAVTMCGSTTASSSIESFPIGIWCFAEDDASCLGTSIDTEKNTEAYYDRIFSDMSNHGINLSILNWTPKHHQNMALDTADKHGIKCIMHLSDISQSIAPGNTSDPKDLRDKLETAVQNIKGHKALEGYYLIDEPKTTPDVAQQIAAVKQMLKSIDPKHSSFSCLLGEYGDLLKTVDFPVLLIDPYPIACSWQGNFGRYEAELERAKRNAGYRPLWVIVQAFGKPAYYNVPTPEQIRAQVWLSIAHGAKGILYFIYQSTTAKQGECLQGLVDKNLKPIDARWEKIGSINKELERLSGILLKLERVDFALPQLPEIVAAQLFVDSDKNKYIILVNKSVQKPLSIKWSGNPMQNMLDNQKVESQISLDPGGGCVLKMLK